MGRASFVVASQGQAEAFADSESGAFLQPRPLVLASVISRAISHVPSVVINIGVWPCHWAPPQTNMSLGIDQGGNNHRGQPVRIGSETRGLLSRDRKQGFFGKTRASLLLTCRLVVSGFIERVHVLHGETSPLGLVWARHTVWA